MAFYRCGGGGIPSSLKTDMNAVFNKKFGTSGQNYPPKQWPDDVNLLGPLPEATATGSIAHITDGADEVPIKSWQVEIAPTLTGKSAIECTQTGSNLWNEEWEEGLISASDGQDTPSDQYSRTKNYIYVKPSSSVYLYFGVARLYIRRYGKDKGYLGYAQINTSSVWNVPNDTYYIRFCWDGQTYNDDISVNYPSTETAYQSSTIATIATASLGRTIYGGAADVVGGSGKEIVKKITVSSFSGTFGAVNNGYAYYISVAGTTHKTSVVNPTMMIANQLFTYGSASRGNAPTWQYGGNDGVDTAHIFILPSEYDTLTKANNFLSSLETPLEVTLTLATPETFTFTPITPTPETALGVNNFWADEGDSEVTYRADINLALGGQ